jgi:muramidase (phage lysozyme)
MIPMVRTLIPQPDVKAGIYYEVTPIRRVYLDFIAWCEGTDKRIDKTPTGYDTFFGGGKFSNFAQHPKKRIKAGGYTSSAAGRYQIMDFTEDWLLQHLKFPPNGKSFLPEFQDQRCLYLIHGKRHALDEVDKDNFKGFCNICSWEWASILPSRYGQGYLTLKQMETAYLQIKSVWGV